MNPYLIFFIGVFVGVMTGIFIIGALSLNRLQEEYEVGYRDGKEASHDQP